MMSSVFSHQRRSLHPSSRFSISDVPQGVQEGDGRRRGREAREGVGRACQGRRAEQRKTLRGDGLREGGREGGREGVRD